MHWVNELHERITANRVVAFAPIVDGKPAGLLWAVPAESGLAFGHHFIMPEFRGWTGFRIVRACLAKLFEVVPDVTHVLGITPVRNRASLVAAQKAGFAKIGVLPRSYDGEDAWIVAHTRENDNG